MLLPVASVLASVAPIVGGSPAALGDYPAVAIIQIVFPDDDGVSTATCTGTLLNQNWVLTAAHCVTPAEIGIGTQQMLTADLSVHFETIDINFSPGRIALAAETIPDPPYNTMVFGMYDVGLIHLAAPVTHLDPVKVSFDPAASAAGSQITIVGYGADQVGTEFSLQTQELACGAWGLDYDDVNEVCIDSTTTGIGGGDSGGPWFIGDGKDLVEVGVTSFTHGQSPVKPDSEMGAAARLAANADFITQHVQLCSADAECPQQPATCFHQTCLVQSFAPSGLGAACSTGADCESTSCATGDGGGKCTQKCTLGAANACPSKFDCTAVENDTLGVCWPHEDAGGCSTGRGGGGGTAVLVGVALFGLVHRRGPAQRSRRSRRAPSVAGR